jgi:sugar lactone lactonase YvrE
MNSPGRLRRIVLQGGLFLGLSVVKCGAADSAAVPPPPRPPAEHRTKLFATLPDTVVTPDGMAIAPDGDLVVACPNFADPSKPACLLRINPAGQVRQWIEVPPLAQTHLACPMGIEFGPDGDLYVCDNQGWSGSPTGAFQGRLLRLRIRDNQVASLVVVASGMEHPNGVRVHGKYVYVTQSLLTKIKDPSGFMVSAVYRFALDDHDLAIANTRDDPQILATFVTENRFCPYGADGLAFDRAGHLYVGNFGDGTIHQLTFDAADNLTASRIFARTDFDRTLDPAKPGFLARATAARMRTTDGIAIDAEDNLHVADFSNNAIARVTPAGRISVLAQNGDTDGRQGELNQPGEPIVWRGKLVITNFDAVVGPDKVNTRHDAPATLSYIPLR